MFKNRMIIISVLAVLVIGVLAACAPASAVSAAVPEDVIAGRCGNGRDGDNPQGNGSSNSDRGSQGNNQQGTGINSQTLTDVEKAGLVDAILEEYGALNLYQSIIDQFGEVSPFVEIARSEQQHVNALVRQAERRGVEVPANPGLASPVTFTSLEEACEAGVQAEIADAALYDALLAGTDNAALIRVYTNLQSASLNSHLPAFEECDCQ